ncbi:MFS transporter [Archaeoglobus sp.]|uniref:MFS transporter n=1 Tax=Archaeoglobus sp. TaxID=1872626 RepID=UPI0025BF8EA1|nr:MFS transporter [Archaeoglobus sp.]
MRALLTAGFILIVFASQAVWVTFSPVLTLVSEEINVSVELLGLLAVTYPIFFLILTIPSGLLLDRDFKKWFLFGSVMTFFAATGRLLSFNYYWLLVCQLSGALGQPFLLNAFVPYASQLYEERRTLVISILSLSMYLGTVFALAAGMKLYNAGGLTMLVLPAAAVATAGIVLVLVAVRAVKFTKAESFAVRQFGAVLRRKDLWIVGAILGFGVATFDNLATWLQPALRSAGLEKVAGDAVALAIVLGLIGVAIIPDRVARMNLRTVYMRSITPLIGAFFVILAFALNATLLFAFLGISGLLMLPAYAIIMDWIGKFCDKEVHGSATGFVGLTSRAISVALTLGAMYFISSAELYFTYLTVPITVAFILTLLLPNDRKLAKISKTF